MSARSVGRLAVAAALLASSPLSAHEAVSQARIDAHRVLLETGAAALARQDAGAAVDAFGRAGTILHSAESEIGLVRAWMQQGEYARALAFASHTAGAHRESADAQRLYRSLLEIGGLDALAADPSRVPGVERRAASDRRCDGASGDVDDASGEANVGGASRAGDTGDAGGAQRIGTIAAAVLVGRGDRAVLAPGALPALEPGASLYVQNGLGQRSAVRRVDASTAYPLVVLELASTLPVAPDIGPVVRAPFPGSPAFAGSYPSAPAVTDAEGATGVPARTATAWPTSTPTFVGKASGPDRRWRDLSIASPCPVFAGPVLDVAGRLVGIAAAAAGVGAADVADPADGKRARHGTHYLLPLGRALGEGNASGRVDPDPDAARAGPPGPSAGTAVRPKPADRIYESMMRHALQVQVRRNQASR
ncbi:MAG: hypothetical protein AB7P21_29605 [Lautropia sp.]